VERRVVHINITNFMAAVEQGRDPSLKNYPFIIAAENQARAAVLGVSELAFKEGIRTGTPLLLAKRRLSRVKVIPPDHELYNRSQQAIFSIACRFSPTVELRSNGHIFIDLTGTGRLFGYSIDAAAKIKRDFQSSLSLDPTTALSANKLVSKVATRVLDPHGFASVPPGDEASFLEPQIVTLLPGVGPKLSSRMSTLGIEFMGELAQLSNDQAVVAFGTRAVILKDHAKGIDTDPVQNDPFAKSSVDCSRIFNTDTNDINHIYAHLHLLTEEAGFLLRSCSMSTSRLGLTVHYTDSKTATRQITISSAVYLDSDIYRITKIILHKALTRRIRVRKLTITLSRLFPTKLQMDLFTPPKNEIIQNTIDNIKLKYGSTILTMGSAIPLIKS
jgi:DNA polymerase IV